MNNLIQLKSLAILMLIALFTFSCGSDNDAITISDDEEEDSLYDGELSVFEQGGDNRNVTINASGLSSTALVKIAFETTTNTMRRLYVTQNVSNFGEDPYEFSTGGVTVDDKKDGSLDLSSDNGNGFEFAIPFPIPASADSKIVYTIWATTGKGDFRDISKRNAISDTAVGTITINGSGTNDGSGLKTYETTILAAPLSSQTSQTFMSVFDGLKYRIDEGEETAALWDFGYYYGATNNASLASVANYPPLFDTTGDGNADSAIAGVSGVAQEELNNFYITTSTLDFDTITERSDLDNISIPTSERVTNLSVGNVLEFVDSYGNKGLIKVTGLVPGDGSSGQITISIKVQSSITTLF
ncbi:hypothetical protein [Aquimarina pacifica]|uniref:hypothetical protein n=1 Tax=Aquimarina pacifica TaxID=1296415 RepID=UPI00046FF4C1|nr:hypothetical protein [Aquimarina pacifica]